MGFSGGFKQGKPGKALLELTKACNNKINGGQFVSLKGFSIESIEAILWLWQKGFFGIYFYVCSQDTS
jgi:hypothetical protein